MRCDHSGPGWRNVTFGLECVDSLLSRASATVFETVGKLCS